MLISVWAVARGGARGVWNNGLVCGVGDGLPSATGVGAIDFFTGGGGYMARTRCMVDQQGRTDWPWVWMLLGLSGLIIAGYLRIFVFWRRAYLQEEPADRNTKLMDLAWIFLLCACCGYLSSIMLFFWPGYRLVGICLIPLAFFTWKFAANLEGFRVSLGAKRLARELNESLVRQNERLGEQVALATSGLEHARLEAERANQAKSEFLARMSHEIRTPMTAILGFVDMALERDIDDGARHEHLRTVRRNSNHLLHLINDVLDVSKIEAGEMRYERAPCSAREIVEDIRTLMGSRACQRGLALHVRVGDEVPACVLTDPTRLRQLISNLVSNAIKFTSSGEVRVEMGVIERGEDGPPEGGGAEAWALLEVRVSDTGIGMGPEQMQRVFDKFTQGAVDTSRHYGGTGLGLTIARRIAQDQGGSLGVSSEPGVGSEFTARLRVGVGEAVLADAERMGEEAGDDGRIADPVRQVLRGARVLLVEDSADNTMLIRHHFAKVGVRLGHASDGASAIAAVTQAQARGAAYELVLMDINMPGIDGIECLGRIRKSGFDVPVVMLSAHALKREQERSFEAGASAYATKPIDFGALFEVCAALLRGEGGRRVA